MDMKKILLFSMILSIGFFMVSCSEEEEPSLYDPDYESNPQPVISAMDPPDSTLAGVGQMTITGQHFMPVQPYNEHNQLYFDAVKADILEMTETEIVIPTPSYIKDTIDVKIAVRGAELFSEPVQYRLKAAVDTTFGGLDDLNQRYVPFSIATDNAGNVYVSCQVFLKSGASQGSILKITPAGETSILTAKTDFLRANGLKYGPDDQLYATMEAGRLKALYKIDPVTGAQEQYLIVSIKPKDLDFDPDGNIWVVGESSLLRVKPDKTVETMQQFTATLKTVRIFETGGTLYVYAAGVNTGSGEQKIWRMSINQDGTLGSPEDVFDIADVSAPEDFELRTFVIAADGTIYLGSSAQPDAMFVYDPATIDMQVLYPGLIERYLYDFCWSPGKFLYATQQNAKADKGNLLKIDMQKLGAVYYGRN